MGSGRFEPKDWKTYSSRSIDTKSSTTGSDGVFASSRMQPELNPHGVTRESRDSADNPNSTPVIVALDVTGSMSNVLDSMARKGLPTLATEIYNRKPITDPHLLFMGVGDAYYDSAPLQVTQFEADIRIAEQLQKIWLEQGGGGNQHEGYIIPWYFAAVHTDIDSMQKRGKKGYLFTVGDENPTDKLTREQVKKIFGDDIQADYSASDLLAMASRSYEVFHLVVEEGHGVRSLGDSVLQNWKNLLGQNAIPLADHTKMAEVIVSILQVRSGEDKSKVAASWDGSTSLVVAKAVSDVTVAEGAGSKGLVTFD